VTGGASAVYGSDAVAGVVNFILNDDFQGAQFDAAYSITDHGDGETENCAATVGAGFDDGRGNVVLSRRLSQQGTDLSVRGPASFHAGRFLCHACFDSTSLRVVDADCRHRRQLVVPSARASTSTRRTSTRRRKRAGPCARAREVRNQRLCRSLFGRSSTRQFDEFPGSSPLRRCSATRWKSPSATRSYIARVASLLRCERNCASRMFGPRCRTTAPDVGVRWRACRCWPAAVRVPLRHLPE
jgi:hypothetical protein